MTLVDTNVLLDIVTDDPVWKTWSTGQFDAAVERGPVSINDIVYAELSVRFETVDLLDTFVEDACLTLAPISRAALFLAGKAHQRYRSAGGVRTGVLPDFFIGAQAAVTGWALLTRDARRYRTYFPSVSLITPFS